MCYHTELSHSADTGELVPMISMSDLEEIDCEAIAKGISPRTVRDAKKELGDALKSRISEGNKKVF